MTLLFLFIYIQLHILYNRLNICHIIPLGAKHHTDVLYLRFEFFIIWKVVAKVGGGFKYCKKILLHVSSAFIKSKYWRWNFGGGGNRKKLLKQRNMV